MQSPTQAERRPPCSPPQRREVPPPACLWHGLPALVDGNDPAALVGWTRDGDPIVARLSGSFGPLRPTAVELLGFDPLPIEEAMRAACESHFASLALARQMQAPR